MNGISFARVQQPTNPDAFTPRTVPTMHQTVSAPAPAPLTAKQRRARRKKQIIYGSIGLMVLCIVASIIWNKREKPIPVTTEKAIRKTIVQTVSATGKVQPETEVKISPEVAGEIIELPVEDGKAVKKDDLLVRIRPDSYKALVEQQEAAISAAKATNLQQKATMSKCEHDVNENDVVNVKVGDKAEVKIDAYGDRKFHGTVYQIANTGKTTGTGTQEEVTNFEVKIRIEDTDVTLKPALSCTAEIHTNEVKDVVAVPMQAVTIRTGESNLSPEEIEKKKQKVAQHDKRHNNAEFVKERAEKAAQKEEREKISKVVFLKKGNKAQIVKVTTGISDDTYTEIKSGIQPGDELISGSYSAISRKLKDGARVTLDKEGMK